MILEENDIKIINYELKRYNNYIYNLIKKEFPELIKTNKGWINLKDKNIFQNFKMKYFSNINLYDDFILCICLKFDISRLNIILNSNNSIIHNFFQSKFNKINSNSWYILFHHFINIFPQLEYYYRIYTYGFNQYLYCYLIYPISIIVIDFYLKYEINEYTCHLVKDYVQLSYFKTKEITSFIDNIPQLVMNSFINNPNELLLDLLFDITNKKIDEYNTYHIINFIKNNQCSFSIYELIKDRCILNKEQKAYIESIIILNRL